MGGCGKRKQHVPPCAERSSSREQGQLLAASGLRGRTSSLHQLRDLRTEVPSGPRYTSPDLHVHGLPSTAASFASTTAGDKQSRLYIPPLYYAIDCGARRMDRNVWKLDGIRKKCFVTRVNAWNFKDNAIITSL